MPHCSVPLPSSGTCPNGDLKAINPKTGALYPCVDYRPFRSALVRTGTSPSRESTSSTNGKSFNIQHPQIGPRFGFAWDVFGDGKMSRSRRLRYLLQPRVFGGYHCGQRRHHGPIKVFPNFQSPTYFNQTFCIAGERAGLRGAADLHRRNLNMKDPTVNNWSFSVQRDIGKGWCSKSPMWVTM